MRGWNFWDMKPQIAENGIRRNLSVINLPGVSILTWKEIADSGEICI